MSMKQYYVGDTVWYKGGEYTILKMSPKYAAIHLDGTDDDIFDELVPLSDLSPHPPVKAVDGWAVVTPTGHILYAVMAPTEKECIELFENQTRMCLPSGYRCIPVTITAKKD